VSKQLHRIGAVDMASSSRENIVYFVDVIRANAEQAVKLLASSVLHPVLDENVIQEGVSNMEFKYHYMAAEILSQDGIVMAAYGKNPLGNRHYPSDLMRLQFLTPELIQKFRSKILFGENCVVAGSGIEHDVFVKLVKNSFKDLPQLPSGPNVPLTTTRSQYCGGLYVEQRELKEPFVKLTLGFEFGGYRSKNLYVACVLERLLGGGSSFSAGGPGKGMYTRLYREVMGRYDWIESVQGLAIVFDQNGLFGIDGACAGQNVMQLYKVMVHELVKLSIAKVTPLELSRAKNMLKSKLLMQLESRVVVGEDLARQVATFGVRESPTVTCAKIDEVTADQIMSFVREILQAPPSISCIGEDVSQIPPYEDLKTYTSNYRDAFWGRYPAQAK
jgi:mitochondrial-processing peptidase subunit alpha